MQRPVGDLGSAEPQTLQVAESFDRHDRYVINVCAIESQVIEVVQSADMLHALLADL